MHGVQRRDALHAHRRHAGNCAAGALPLAPINRADPVGPELPPGLGMLVLCVRQLRTECGVAKMASVGPGLRACPQVARAGLLPAETTGSPRGVAPVLRLPGEPLRGVLLPSFSCRLIDMRLRISYGRADAVGSRRT